LLVGSGVVYGILSKQTVSEKEKEAVAGILLKESDLVGLQYSVEPQEPTTPEEEAFEKKIESCYTDGVPSEMYEIDGDGFVFENLSGMTIRSWATIYESSSEATKELLSIEDESYVSCSKGFAREYIGSSWEKNGETLSVLEMEPYDESVSGVVSRGTYIYVESSTGFEAMQFVVVMQRDAVLVSVSMTLNNTNAEILQQSLNSTGFRFLEEVHSVIADRLRLAVLETK
jgi:hypothetical protein